MHTRLPIGAFGVVVLFTHGASPPTQDFTVLIGTVGTDTVAVDRYTRDETKLEGVLLVRSPRTHTMQYNASLVPGGRISQLEMLWRDAAGTEVRSARITFGIDSVRSTFKNSTERSVSGPPTLDAIPLPPRPYAYQAYSMLEHAAILVTVSKRPGNVPIEWMLTGAKRLVPGRSRRLVADTLQIGFIDGQLRAQVGEAGRLVWLSGKLGGMETLVRRSEADVDMDALKASFAARDTLPAPPARR